MAAWCWSTRAACSPVAEELDWARANLGADIMRTDDYAAILRHPEVNAVVLVTPTSLHAEQIIAAIAALKPAAIVVGAIAFQIDGHVAGGGGFDLPGVELALRQAARFI